MSFCILKEVWSVDSTVLDSGWYQVVIRLTSAWVWVECRLSLVKHIYCALPPLKQNLMALLPITRILLTPWRGSSSQKNPLLLIFLPKLIFWGPLVDILDCWGTHRRKNQIEKLVLQKLIKGTKGRSSFQNMSLILVQYSKHAGVPGSIVF